MHVAFVKPVINRAHIYHSVHETVISRFKPCSVALNINSKNSCFINVQNQSEQDFVMHKDDFCRVRIRSYFIKFIHNNLFLNKEISTSRDRERMLIC